MRARATLTVVTVLLAGAIWAESRHGVMSDWLMPDAPPAVQPSDAGGGKPLTAGGELFVVPTVTPVEDLTQTVERPLFDRSRRPAANVVDTGAPEPPPLPPGNPPQVVLTAVVITDLDRVALLQVAGAEELLRLREGQEVSGWQLTQVTAEGITLAQGTNTHEVALRTYQPAPAPARPQRRQRARRTDRRRARQRDENAEASSQSRPARRSSRRRSGQGSNRQ